VCTSYRLGEKTMKHFPTDAATLQSVEPHYETFDGWKISVAGARKYVICLEAPPEYVEAPRRATGTRSA